MTRLDYYKTIEAELININTAVRDRIPEDSQKQFNQFIAVGEYALALEEITGSIIEGGHAISQEIFDKISVLARTMKIANAHWQPIKILP
jgi:hypothetical protein